MDDMKSSDLGSATCDGVDNLHSLAGEWQIRLDRDGAGMAQGWFTQAFAGDAARLPGTMDTLARVPPVHSGDLKGFAPVYPYVGAVWFQREVEIPESWRGKHVSLFLERCQWETMVWVDSVCQGTRNSLVAPHVYDLTDVLVPGRHRLTILVDNANRRTGMEVGPDNMLNYDLTTEVKAGAKLNCGGHHHAWSHNWNGIIGRLELQARPLVHILSVQAHPDVAVGEVRVAIRLANLRGAKGRVRLAIACEPVGDGAVAAEGGTDSWAAELTGDAEQVVERRFRPAEPMLPWDEFSPRLYNLRVELDGDAGADAQCVRFGMRSVGTEGRRLLLNGRTLFLRGTLECFIFPLTGHPPVDVPSWRKLLSVAKSYGLNFLRFHTCCPPEAAFAAADELGLYFQVELPGTSCPSQDESPEVENYLSAELARILECYGNHPSFLLLSMGNEQLIANWLPDFIARHQEVLARKVRFARERDPRHLYTSTSQPWTPGRIDDFFVSAWPVSGTEPLSGIAWGGGYVIDCSRFNTRPPETVFDYASGLEGLERPLLTHEVGQWMVYPDLREISRYHGAQRAFNYEIIREQLREKGLLEWAGDFTRASGMLALALYKEEIESALRTRGLSGFQFLDLHDFPGQGTSPVGILSALRESKGLTTPAAFRSFCGPVTPLARLPKRVWTTGETFTATLDIANYGVGDEAGIVEWLLQDESGHVHGGGRLAGIVARQGEVTTVGSVTVPLGAIRSPSRLTFRAELDGGRANSWDLWLYSEDAAAEVPAADIVIAEHWSEATKAVLQRGGSVLLVPGRESVRDPIPGTFTPVFWNPQMKDMQVAKTMGLLCDPAHPALAEFPTEFHSNWQWWDPVMRSNALSLDGFPAAMRPVVQVVDSFPRNRRLAMVFEARVGAGRLLVCASDILSDLAARPAARQLRRSLLRYMAGPFFLPDVAVTEEMLDGLFLAAVMSKPVVAWQVSELRPRPEGGVAQAPPPAADLAWEPGRIWPGWHPNFPCGGFLNLHDRFGQRDGIVYCRHRVSVDRDGQWRLHLGHDGGVRVFVDGLPVFCEPSLRTPCLPGRSAVTLSLARGEHELAIAFDTCGGQGWGISLQIEALGAAMLLPSESFILSRRKQQGARR
jgi:hypothetical protein